MTALARLTGDAATFATETWGARPHLHDGDRDDLAALLTLDDVDRLVTSSAIRTPSIRLARDGSVLPRSCFTRRASLAGSPLTGLVDPRRLLEEFSDGATVVLQGLQRSWPPINRLVAELEDELGHPGQANAYLTPPEARGFAVHADSHDVFVVQTHGRKHWEIHGAHEGDDVQDLELRPGHVLYLPTGTRHAARAMGEASLHVTVGIRPITWRAVLDRAISEVVDDLDDLDAPLAAGWTRDPHAIAPRLKQHLRTVAEALVDHDEDLAMDDEVQRFLTGRPTRVAGGLRDRLAVAGLGDDTLVRRRPGHPMVLVPGDDHDDVRVLLGDRVLRVPGWVRPALEAIQARNDDRFRPNDLATWLDPTSRVILVRRLVVEGLLTIEA